MDCSLRAAQRKTFWAAPAGIARDLRGQDADSRVTGRRTGDLTLEAGDLTLEAEALTLEAGALRWRRGN
jgi:hypothetical protein